MRKTIYFIVYVVVAVIGLLLLIFNHQALETRALAVVLHDIVIAGGIIFIVPGVVMLLSSLRPKHDALGNVITRPWFSTLIGVLALIWGITMICMPDGFIGNLNITLGVSLILAGVAQIIWIVKSASSTILRFIVPAAAIAVGILLLTILNHYPDNGKSAQMAAILSGISFMVWSVNGIVSLRSPGVARAAHEAAKEERKSEKEQRKADKEAALDARKEEEKELKAKEAGKPEDSDKETGASEKEENNAGPGSADSAPMEEKTDKNPSVESEVK